MSHDEREVDVTRRDLGTFLGILGGAAGLAAFASACSAAGSPSPAGEQGLEPTATEFAAVTATGVQVVATIALLRGTSKTFGVNGATSPVAVVESYAKAGDGGGGVFVWVPTVVTDGGVIGDDSGTIIVPCLNSTCKATGYWRRICSGPFNVKWFGAVGDGLADDTSALQNAINANAEVYLPAGTFRITTALTIPVSAKSVKVVGAGILATTVTIDGAINGFYRAADGVLAVEFADFSVTGDGSTLDAFRFDAVVVLSEFRNLSIAAGGHAIYMPGGAYSNVFNNVRFSSLNNHGIEMEGGPSTNFISCYASLISGGSQYAGFRIYGGANFFGCNGVDGAGRWAILGQSILQGDATNSQYFGYFVGCNFEGASYRAIELRFDGIAKFISCTFLPPFASSTYQCSVWVEYGGESVYMENCLFLPGSGANATPATWMASTSYIVGSMAANMSGGNVYLCTQAGISGAAPPSGTGTGILDGGCKWNYLSPAIARSLLSELFSPNAGAGSFTLVSTVGLGQQPLIHQQITTPQGQITNYMMVADNAFMGQVAYLQLGRWLSNLGVQGTAWLNQVLIGGGAMTAGTGQLSLGAIATPTASAGNVTPPTQVAGYLEWNLAGTPIKIPYYNA